MINIIFCRQLINHQSSTIVNNSKPQNITLYLFLLIFWESNSLIKCINNILKFLISSCKTIYKLLKYIHLNYVLPKNCIHSIHHNNRMNPIKHQNNKEQDKFD
jgi:hypothetical protein